MTMRLLIVLVGFAVFAVGQSVPKRLFIEQRTRICEARERVSGGSGTEATRRAASETTRDRCVLRLDSGTLMSSLHRWRRNQRNGCAFTRSGFFYL
jgi:hypothetical protein